MRVRDGMLRCLMVVALLAAQVAAPLLHTHSADSAAGHSTPEAHMHLLVDDHAIVEDHAEQASIKADPHHSDIDAHYLSAHTVTASQQTLKDFHVSSAQPMIIPNLPNVSVMAGLRHPPALPPPLEQAGLAVTFGFDAQAPPLV